MINLGQYIQVKLWPQVTSRRGWEQQRSCQMIQQIMGLNNNFKPRFTRSIIAIVENIYWLHQGGSDRKNCRRPAITIGGIIERGITSGKKAKEVANSIKTTNGRIREEYGEVFSIRTWCQSSLLTRRNREVVDFTLSRVKNNSELTNLMNISRIEGYNGK